MTQRELNHAVARQTGESVRTIERLGFLLSEPEVEYADQARPLLVDWDTFISRPGGHARLSERIPLLARACRFDEIPQAAEMLRSLDAENFENLYNAACGYALCANAIQGEDGESLTSEQEAQRQEYVDLALACLSESIAAGFTDFKHMQQDSDLAIPREPSDESLVSLVPFSVGVMSPGSIRG